MYFHKLTNAQINYFLYSTSSVNYLTKKYFPGLFYENLLFSYYYKIGNRFCTVKWSHPFVYMWVYHLPNVTWIISLWCLFSLFLYAKRLNGNGGVWSYEYSESTNFQDLIWKSELDIKAVYLGLYFISGASGNYTTISPLEQDTWFDLKGEHCKVIYSSISVHLVCGYRIHQLHLCRGVRTLHQRVFWICY